MKIRIGFVSNSSSSSFVCDICKEEVSGLDISLLEVEMRRCVDGHTWCDSHHKITTAELRQSLTERMCETITKYHNTTIEDVTDEELDDISRDQGWDRAEVPSLLCPLCNFNFVSDRETIAYLLDKAGLTKQELSSILKREFGDYNKFKKVVK